MEQQSEQTNIIRYHQSLVEMQKQQCVAKVLSAQYTVHAVAQGKRLKITDTSQVNSSCAALSITSSDDEDDDSAPICVYPKGRGGNAIYAADLERLNEGRFLNDTIVNVVLAWLINHELSVGRQTDTRLCDSHMFSQLTRDINQAQGPHTAGHSQRNYDKVSRWFPGDGPFDRGLTFIPVCERSHWLLVTVLVDRSDETPIATIFVMDSLEEKSRGYIASTISDFVSYVLPAVRPQIFRVPVNQRRNMTDCGLHLLHNAQRFLDHTEKHPHTTGEELTEALNAEPWPVSRAEVKDMIQKIINARRRRRCFATSPWRTPV